MSKSEHSQQSEEGLSASVLILDDHDDLRRLFQLGFEAAGFTVIAAATQLELQSRLSESRPDALVLDLQRSQTEGLHVLARMRARTQLLDVPMLFLSGSEDADLRRHVLAAGADWFGLRPVSIIELQTELGRLVRDGRTSVMDKPRSRQTIVAR